MEEKHKEKVLPELVEPARSVSVAHNHEATQPSIKKKRRLVLPSYSSANEEYEVHFLVVKEDKQVPAVKQNPRKRMTKSEGLKLLFSAIDSLN